MLHVPQEVQRRRLGRRHKERPSGRIQALRRHVFEMLAEHEHHTHRPAADRAMALGQEDLELLRPVMRSAVILRRRQKTHVVGELELLHERRNELVRGKARERAIFRWHDDVEAPRRGGDEPLFCETVQRQLGCCGRNTQR